MAERGEEIDALEGHWAGRPLPLRACLLSGGESRRMGRDKALLPHPEGGTWLERSLRLLAGLGMPITLLSRHAAHHRLAASLAEELAVPLERWLEPPPWEGPLLALGRLMEAHPGEALLLCPVDMPRLTAASLQTLLARASKAPDRLHAAQDGTLLQPLLAVVPADDRHRHSLATALAAGERGLQRWMTAVGYCAVPLAAAALHNANDPEDLGDLTGPRDQATPSARPAGS